jgi:hypothetical protein
MYPTMMLDPIPNAMTYGPTVGTILAFVLVALVLAASLSHPSFRSALVGLVSGLRSRTRRMIPAASHGGSY